MSAPHESIGVALRGAQAEGRTALVAYLTAGFPRRETFGELVTSIGTAADVVEIGVPFTDPMADGTTIQRSSRAALEQGVTLQWILEELARLAPRPRAPLLLMSYLNPLLAYGIERLPAEAARCGITGFIVPDLPCEESADWNAALDAQGLALVQFVTPVTPVERIGKLCAASRGFVYAVTMTGTTGKNVAVPAETLAYFERVRKISTLPVCAGFGIRTREQVRKLAPYVDGAIVGSALVEALERGEDPAAFLRSLRA